jgi:hypothetical protein
MTLFFTTLLLTVPLLVGAALLINFCRRRVGRTRHGLTGMCHQSGGRMCGCCASSLQSRTDRQVP